MDQPVASASPSHRPSARRPTDAPAPCRARIERGVDCVIPGDPATDGWCPRHDPGQAESRRFQALQASRAAHAPRALRFFGPDWAPDLSTWENRIAVCELVAAARGRGDIDDKAAATLLKAVSEARENDATPRGKPAPGAIIVEVARPVQANGHEPAG